jgi:hypothetical protein
MTGATTVTATFTLQTNVLTVVRAGTGAGSVTSDPTGIACGTDCVANENYGTTVTLTAMAGANSTFAGWSGGGCTGTGTCVVTVTAATTVTATFTLVPEMLTVVVRGTGTGSVSGGAIACPGTCTETAGYGTMVTLTATPSTAAATASKFAGWSGGGCTGTGTCTVTLTAATTVTAGFTLSPNIMFVTNTASTGDLAGPDGADKTCGTLARAAGFVGTYVAYLSSTSVAGVVTTAASRVGSATGWVRPDGTPIMNTVDQLVAGTLFNAPSETDKLDDISTYTSPLVWTGTNKDGSYEGQCTSPASGLPWAGTGGRTYGGNATATTVAAIALSVQPCAALLHLYCMGTDRKAIAQ